jgi:cytochrome c551/c552
MQLVVKSKYVNLIRVISLLLANMAFAAEVDTPLEVAKVKVESAPHSDPVKTEVIENKNPTEKTEMVSPNESVETEAVKSEIPDKTSKTESTPPSEPVKTETVEPIDPVEQTKKVMDLIAQKQYPCLGCHQLETKTIGPSFKDIAKKYRREKSLDPVITGLSEKIKNGGAGVWGEIMMPENPSISYEDLTTIVRWILSLPTTD